jgi:hypothetical protein
MVFEIDEALDLAWLPRAMQRDRPGDPVGEAEQLER